MTTENKLIIGDNLTILKTLPDNSVDAIITDPPYLTGNSKLSYYDNKSEQEWVVFMTDRLIECKRVMKDTASMLINIDENMVVELNQILFNVFGKKNKICQFVWKKRSSGSAQSKFATIEHEYIVAFAKNIKKCKWNGIPQFEAKDITLSFNPGNTLVGPNQTYPIYADDGTDFSQRFDKTSKTERNPETRPNATYPLYYDGVPGGINEEEGDKIYPYQERGNGKGTNQTYPIHISKFEGNKPHFSIEVDEELNDEFYNHPFASTDAASKSRPKSDDKYPLYYNKEDETGNYRDNSFDMIGDNPNPQTSQIYPISANQTKISLTPFPGSIEIMPMNGRSLGCWRAIPATCQKLIDANMLVVKNNKIYQKQYAHYQFNKKTGKLEPFVRTTPIRTILQGDKYPTNLRSNKEIKEIFRSSKFTYAKPLELIKNLLKIISNERDTVLDIFAGSGTTGQAAFESNRQFILIQLSENGIEELTKQRLNHTVGNDNYDLIIQDNTAST